MINWPLLVTSIPHAIVIMGVVVIVSLILSQS